MNFLIGFILGLTLGIGGMAIWLVPKINDLEIERLKQNRTIKHLVNRQLNIS